MVSEIDLVSGMKYGGQSFHTAITSPFWPSFNKFSKAAQTSEVDMRPPTCFFIFSISVGVQPSKIGVTVTDGHKQS